MKKNKIAILATLVFALVLIVMPLVIQAQATDVQGGLQGLGGQINATGGTGLFRSTDSPVQIIGKVIRLLLIVSGAIAVLFVVIGGFMYMTSAGNEEQATKGRKTLIYAIVGIVITVLAYVIVSSIVNLVTCQGFFGC